VYDRHEYGRRESEGDGTVAAGIWPSRKGPKEGTWSNYDGRVGAHVAVRLHEKTFTSPLRNRSHVLYVISSSPQANSEKALFKGLEQAQTTPSRGE